MGDYLPLPFKGRYGKRQKLALGPVSLPMSSIVTRGLHLGHQVRVVYSCASRVANVASHGDSGHSEQTDRNAQHRPAGMSLAHFCLRQVTIRDNVNEQRG